MASAATTQSPSSSSAPAQAQPQTLQVIPKEAHQYIRPGGAQTRGFAYNLTFEVGVSYLAGIGAGGSIGALSAMRKLQTHPHKFTTRLKVNQIMNAAGKMGSQTANGFAVFALTYSLTRDLYKFYVRPTPEDDPSNEAIGAAVAGTIQGLTRFPKVPALGCGIALGTITYVTMKYGMDTVKKLPFRYL